MSAERDKKGSPSYAVPYRRGNKSSSNYITRVVADVLGSCRPVIDGEQVSTVDPDYLRRFYVHMVVAAETTSAQYGYKGEKVYTPIPYRCLLKICEHKHKGSLIYRPFVDAGLMEMTPHDVANAKCTYLRLTDDELMRFYNAEISGDADEIINLVTGRQTTKRIKQQYRTPNKKLLYPTRLGRHSQMALNIHAQADVPIDKEGMMAALEEAKAVAMHSGDPGDAAWARVCLESVSTVLSRATRAADGQWTYQAVYNVISTGRRMEVGRGLQGAPSIIKAGAWSSLIEAGKLYNYDLQCAHTALHLYIAGVINQHEAYKPRRRSMPAGHTAADISPEYLDEYVAAADYRMDLIALPYIDTSLQRSYVTDRAMRSERHQDLIRIGLTPDQAKEVYIGLLNGLTAKGIAEMVPRTAQGIRMTSRILKATAWQKRICDASTQRLVYWANDCLRHTHVGCNYHGMPKGLQDLIRFRRTPGGVDIINAVGMAAPMLDNSGRWPVDGAKTRRPAMAWSHILQGAETLVMDHITLLCDERGLGPLHNQHDGLITLMPIDDDLVREACKNAGIAASAVSLVQKPFASKMRTPAQVTSQAGDLAKSAAL